MLMGRMHKTPLDVLRPSLHTSVLLRQLRHKLQADRVCCSYLQDMGDSVLAKNFCLGPPWVPARVTSTTGQSAAMVRLSDGTAWHRQGDHLRPQCEEVSEPTAGPPMTQNVCSHLPTVRHTDLAVSADSDSAMRATSGIEEKSVNVTGGAEETAMNASKSVCSMPQLQRSTGSRKLVQRYSP